MSDLPMAKKYLGQHWLTDVVALQAICDVGEITAEDTVLEIGPGTGTLTRFLVQQAKQVIAVEFDTILATKLPEQITATNLTVVEQDILAYNLTLLPANYKVIANIPYYLTSKLIRTLSETTNQASRVVLLIQKEVAQRVAAAPSGMSLLSVSAQFYWQVALGLGIPAKMFTPPPKVDSQVLILSRRTGPLFAEVDEKQFFRIVKAGFSARRKTLLNSLSAGLRLPKDQTMAIIKAAGLAPTGRPQELSLTDWFQLYTQVNKNT